MKHQKLLAKALDVTAKEASELLASGDYIVLTDREADKQCREYILASVWAFSSSFLAAHLKPGIDQNVVDSIQSYDKCEDNNAVIIALIDDVNHFIDDAIACDGRGHFLSGYDGQEIEIGNNLFAYRIN